MRYCLVLLSDPALLCSLIFFYGGLCPPQPNRHSLSLLCRFFCVLPQFIRFPLLFLGSRVIYLFLAFSSLMVS